ncbi:hypothetical protein AKO1_005818 [Acrasis kona]|uniref:Uncharacterized protein n=1 Tax=Acrasis kona TaxID=1008807 RepID=A0AAW2YJZ6_9EUKA
MVNYSFFTVLVVFSAILIFSSPTNGSTLDNIHHENCTVIEQCRLCDIGDKHEICTEGSDSYYQLLECIDDGTNKDKYQMRRKCTPDIYYTNSSLKNFFLFEGALMTTFLMFGYLYIRRKRFLLSQQELRYQRLTTSITPTQGNQDSSDSDNEA